MFDALWILITTGDAESILPILSTAIQSRVSQELFVWGIVLTVISKKVSTFLNEAKTEIKDAKNELSVEVAGVKDAIHSLTQIIHKVEGEHFSATSEINARVQRQADAQKEITERQMTIREILAHRLNRIIWLEETVQGLTGKTPPEQHGEAVFK